METNEYKRISLERYFKAVIGKMETGKHFSTARNYSKTMDSFMAFSGNDGFMVSDLTQDMVAAYNEYLENRHVTRNTISFYNRVLRALYNKAVKEGYVPRGIPDPFEDVYTGRDLTRKRALSRNIIMRIARMKLKQEEEMELSRDLFLFSFYARGMCFVDMAFLTWDDIRDDYIFYVRSKTSRRMEVKIEPYMAAIIKKWKSKASLNYVFPLISAVDPREAYEEYVYRLNRHNHMLRVIGLRVESPFQLNSYVARHSWATLARDAGVPINVISSCMGHTSEKTTKIYLSELDRGILNRANRKIISYTFGGRIPKA